MCESRADAALAELGLELELSAWAPWRLVELPVGQQKQGCLRDLRRFGYWPVTSTILKRASFRIIRP